MIGADEIEAAILEMINEDRYGLYEIIWTLNTSHPDVSEADKVAAARPVVKELVARGQIILGRERWASSHSARPLDAAETDRILGDPASWTAGDEFVDFEHASQAGGAA